MKPLNKFKRMVLVFLYLVAPASLSGCNTAPKMTAEEKYQEMIKEMYKKEGYYNRYPIQIYIDNSFSAHNKNLIKTSLIELDEALEGIKFEYNDTKPTSFDREYSYINIEFDKNGKLGTLPAYRETTSNERLAFSTFPTDGRSVHHYSDVYTFDSTITIGSFLTISEDIPKSKTRMGLEIKWNNYEVFSAYHMQGYWTFKTRYNEFRERIENALKGLTKHEAGHSLGFVPPKGQAYEGEDGKDPFHSNDKKSIMYPFATEGSAVRANKLSDDVINYMNKKYPKDKGKEKE